MTAEDRHNKAHALYRNIVDKACRTHGGIKSLAEKIDMDEHAISAALKRTDDYLRIRNVATEIETRLRQKFS